MHLVEDLLDVSKLTSGRLDLQLEEADLVALVRGALGIYGGVAHAGWMRQSLTTGVRRYRHTRS